MIFDLSSPIGQAAFSRRYFFDETPQSLSPIFTEALWFITPYPLPDWTYVLLITIDGLSTFRR